MKYLFFVAAIAAIGLAGCVDQKAREQANVARCTRYGVPPGSPGFPDCMMQAAQLDALEDQVAAARVQAAGAALQGAAASMRASEPDTVHCTSIKTGDITNTTCN